MEEKLTKGQGEQERFTALLGLCAPAAKQPLRDTRIEMLKALHAVINDRLSHLLQPTARASRIAVK